MYDEESYEVIDCCFYCKNADIPFGNFFGKCGKVEIPSTGKCKNFTFAPEMPTTPED